ncbi:aldo/keto reductase [Helicovermis profundi]|uniref:Aldo/keto reductase n=1 Tax=Helicovermis profundi TaxID=3065157 RepID=A0AAU9EYP0_9FIRM|nr:aldo/keto reductase [Clostridia bacterium S502]
MEKICLGTVQFGMDYGINNKKGKRSVNEIHEIIKFGIDKGIVFFDTAPVYGDAEEIIGDYILKNKLDEINIFTKLTLEKNDITCEKKELREIIFNQVNTSIKKMNLKKLYALLLHNPEYMYNERIVNELYNLKKIGVTKNIGVSIYNVEDALYAVNNLKIDYIQIPFNVFDLRLNKTNFFEITKEKNIKVLARSSFLQGLLFMEPNDAEKRVKNSGVYLNKFNEILKKYDYTVLEGALLFSKYSLGIDYIVIGVDSLDQLIEINEIYGKSVSKEYIKEINETFLNVDYGVLLPYLWSKKH